MLKWIAIAAALLVGAASAADVPAGFAGAAANADSARVAVLSAQAAPLEEQVDVWIAALSEDEAFAGWKDAAWSKKALGPGTHGWLILVRGKADGTALGYMIVAAKPDGGYELVEYGVGETAPFSESVLDMALRSDGLEGIAFSADAVAEPLYYSPVHAMWKVSEGGAVRFADAFSGAWLPLSDAEADALPVAASGGEGFPFGKRLHYIAEAADPYMSLEWLDAPAAKIGDWDAFLDWFADREGKAMFAASALGGELTLPIGVAGYHWWAAAEGGGMRYAALDHEGLLRYVPLAALLSSGTFH